MDTITREELNQQCASCCSRPTVVEVLSEEHFHEFHLPGAINVPLGADFDQNIQQAVPDKKAAVVVYCGSAQCKASEEAARHLDKLGYEHVFDYEAGKADWKEAGLPTEA